MNFNKILDSIKDFFSNIGENLKRVNWDKYKLEYNPDNEYQNFAIFVLTSMLCFFCLKVSISFFKSGDVGVGVVFLIFVGVLGAYIYKFFKTHFLK